MLAIASRDGRRRVRLDRDRCGVAVQDRPESQSPSRRCCRNPGGVDEVEAGRKRVLDHYASGVVGTGVVRGQRVVDLAVNRRLESDAVLTSDRSASGFTWNVAEPVLSRGSRSCSAWDLRRPLRWRSWPGWSRRAGHGRRHACRERRRDHLALCNRTQVTGNRRAGRRTRAGGDELEAGRKRVGDDTARRSNPLAGACSPPPGCRWSRSACRSRCHRRLRSAGRDGLGERQVGDVSDPDGRARRVVRGIGSGRRARHGRGVRGRCSGGCAHGHDERDERVVPRDRCRSCT